jgi:hypothetical protein
MGAALAAPRAARAQNFHLASSPPIGASTIWALAQDLNGDGKADFLTSSYYNPGFLTVVTNNGDGAGTFAVSQTVNIASLPDGVTAADLNGDHLADLIVANTVTNYLSILTNAGGGTFVLATNVTVENGPRSSAAADFGRGVVDIVSANYNDATLTLLTNNGAGAFGSNALYTMDGSVQAIVAADVNGDSKLDLVMAVDGYVGVTVMTNKGNGTFAKSANYYLGQIFPQQIAAVDVNADHKLDIIVSDEYSNEVFVLTNNGSGQFTVLPFYQVRKDMSSFTVIDFNNDGSPDFVCASYDTNALQVFTNNGAGAFTLAPDFLTPSSSYFLMTADVNGDGLVDLIGARQNFFADVFTNAAPPPPPALSIQGTATNSDILSWDWGRTNFVLQQNTNITTTNWVAVPNSLGAHEMVLPRQPGSVLYRLKK